MTKITYERQPTEPGDEQIVLWPTFEPHLAGSEQPFTILIEMDACDGLAKNDAAAVEAIIARLSEPIEFEVEAEV